MHKETRLHAHKVEIAILTLETVVAVWCLSSSPPRSVGYSVQDTRLIRATGAHYRAGVIYASKTPIILQASLSPISESYNKCERAVLYPIDGEERRQVTFYAQYSCEKFGSK